MPTLKAMPQKQEPGEPCPFCSGGSEDRENTRAWQGTGQLLRRGGLEGKGGVILEDKEENTLGRVKAHAKALRHRTAEQV